MKLCLLVTQMEPGGAQNAAYKLYKGLSNEHNVKLVFLYKKSPFLERSENIDWLRESKPKTPFGYVGLFISLFTYLRKFRPGAILSFGQYVNVFGQFLGLLTNTKKRIASQRNPKEYNFKLLNFFDKWWAELGVYTDIIMVSKSVKDSYNNYTSRYMNKVVVIPNGVSVMNLSTDNSKQELVENSKFNLLTVGRLSPEKNQITIINAVKGLEYIDLYIIGEGPLKKEFLQLSKVYTNIKILGSIAHKKIPYYMKACDLFLLPSKYEGMSNALLEAIVYEMPVLISDIDANTNVFMDSEIANAIHVEDVNAWKNSIIELSKDKNKLNDLKQLSREVSAKYSYQRMIDNFRKILLN